MRKISLCGKWRMSGNVISEGTVLFTAPKHFKFVNPELQARVDGDEIVISAKTYAKSAEIFRRLRLYPLRQLLRYERR